MEEEQKEGAPAWMVSFGDMMTLILTFFILLVSMSKEQQEGLVAAGVGSFVIALRSFGLNGVLDGAEEAAIAEEVRTRFKQPKSEPNQEPRIELADLELLRAKSALALAPVKEIGQPALAVFAHGSAELSGEAQRYIDLLIPSLRPAGRAVLQLEGHAGSNEPGWEGRGYQLAFQRAFAVQNYLIERHEISRARLHPRVWLQELDSGELAVTAVDARLILPTSTAKGR